MGVVEGSPVASKYTPRAVTAAPASSALPSADEARKMNKLKALSAHDKELLAVLQQRLEDQKKDLETREFTINAIQRNFENLSAMAQADRQELVSLRKQRQTDSTEIARLNHLLASADQKAKQGQIALETATVAQSRCQELQDKITRMESEHANATSAAVRLKENERRCKELQSMNQALVQEVDSLKAGEKKTQEETEKLVKRMKEMTAEKGALTTSIKAKEAGAQKLHDVIRNLESEKDNALARIQKFEKSILAVQREANEARRQLDEFKKLANQTAETFEIQRNTEKTVADKTISKLTTDLNAMQSELVLLKKNHANELDEMESLRARILLLGSGGYELSQIQEKLNRKEIELSQLRTELDQANGLLKTLHNSHEQMIGEFIKEREILDRRLMVAEQDKDAFERNSIQFAQKNRDMEGEWQAFKARLESDSNEKDATVQRLRDELEQAQSLARQQRAIEEDGNAIENSAKQIRSTLEKIRHASEAMEGALTCLYCMNVYEKPTTCVPCGHSFCRKCVDEIKRKNQNVLHCHECGKKVPVQMVIDNTVLENLCSKYAYNRQAVEALQAMSLPEIY
eukprot:GILK01008849.1.p1 GENE.GILK01008849.1~~GILK01008849.1.p1  ORF type:complete len:576 (-),score=155.59 GILK01008849.1:121-1848(-)